ncbi:MAG: hypothetical protein ACOC85_04060 [Thermoplasmatota archaeon]
MRSNEGVFTLYDAVLFFVFLIIASSFLLICVSPTFEKPRDRRMSFDHCEKTRRAILSSTIEYTSYIQGNENISREDITVRRLLLEQMYLEKKGIARRNFSYNEDISNLINRHIDNRTWLLIVTTCGNEDLIIGKDGMMDIDDDISSVLGLDYVSSSWKEIGIDGEEVEIIFYLEV